MANTREIRRRIRSVKNTRQITKAMELVAASKMKRAQEAATSGRPYAALLAEMLSYVGPRAGDFEHPFLEQRETRRRGVLLVTTDRGLCGALNANLFRELVGFEGDIRYVAVGRKGAQFLGRAKRDLAAEFSVDDKVPYGKVKQAVEYLVRQYLDKEVDTVEILYPRFVNTLVQEPTLLRLLPIANLEDAVTKLRGPHAETFAPASDEREFKFEPDADAILSAILPLFVYREAFQALLSAKASENSARMVAMKTASDNASNLIDDLTLDYNKARQAAITQEILEIAAATAGNQ